MQTFELKELAQIIGFKEIENHELRKALQKKEADIAQLRGELKEREKNEGSAG